jgi:hypothetical protein
MGKKWTPGPWFAIANLNYRGAKWRICNNPNEPWENYGEICYAREGNAHLIAAAPELYEALAALLSRVGNDADAHAWFLEEQENAIKALAKARGETGERGE